MRLLLRSLLFAILVSQLFASCLAGVVFEIETQDYDYSPPRTEQTRVYAEGRSLKMETSAGQRGRSDAVIFRGDRREMVVVDHQRKSYMVIDQQFVANMTSQLGQAAEQMKGMLDDVPAEQRAMVEQMMKGRGSQVQQHTRPQIQVSNTGKREKVYGYPCVLFVVTRNGRKVRDVWVTDWNNIKGGRELSATFGNMSDFVQELTSSLPMQASSPMDDNAFSTIKQMGGFPVATREYREDGTLESESALRSAESRRINADDLQPPAGYQAESMFGGAALGPSQRQAGSFQQNGR